jgi:hypothetical protein
MLKKLTTTLVITMNLMSAIYANGIFDHDEILSPHSLTLKQVQKMLDSCHLRKESEFENEIFLIKRQNQLFRSAGKGIIISKNRKAFEKMNTEIKKYRDHLRKEFISDDNPDVQKRSFTSNYFLHKGEVKRTASITASKMTYLIEYKPQVY